MRITERPFIFAFCVLAVALDGVSLGMNLAKDGPWLKLAWASAEGVFFMALAWAYRPRRESEAR